MYTVTRRVKSVSQPRGGFVNPKQFTVIHTEDNSVVSINDENIRASQVGTAVDYLTRFMTGSDKEKAFETPIKGAANIRESSCCDRLLERIKGLDDDSIFAACQLTGYDVVYRQGKTYYSPIEETQPNKATIENIRIMVKRSLRFWEQYGPVVMDGFTFEGGYTRIISAGDGDFLTADTLWDFKVLSTPPKSVHTLQLLVYYLMGKHSVHPEFNRIKRLGIFNPRLNNVYLLDVDTIPSEIIEAVSTDVIGY